MAAETGARRQGEITAGEPVRVLAVDDHAWFRGVVRDVIASAPGFVMAGEAQSGEEAIELVEELAARLVLMDKRLPGVSGIEACRAITQRHPDVVVVICSVEDPDPDLLGDCGAARVVHKQDLSSRRLAEWWRAHGH